MADAPAADGNKPPDKEADRRSREQVDKRLAQPAADDERVAAAAAAADRPHPGHVARLEEDDQRHAGERGPRPRQGKQQRCDHPQRVDHHWPLSEADRRGHHLHQFLDRHLVSG